MDSFVKIIKSLSDRTRTRILKLLLKAGKPLCICEIVDSLGLVQYNVSKHVKELKNAGLISERREGKFIFYSLVSPENNFHKYILKAFESIDDKTVKDDERRLEKRLCCRVDDKCVIGFKK